MYESMQFTHIEYLLIDHKSYIYILVNGSTHVK